MALKIQRQTILFIFLALLMSDAIARPLVAVTVPAQAWLVKQIADEKVELLTMIPTGHVPESAQPGPRNLSRFQQADIHFTVGDPAFSFESRYISPYREKADPMTWLSMFEIAGDLVPARKLKDIDPHLWTSPAVMLASANVLEQTLAGLDPHNAALYRSNLLRLQEKITNLDRQLRDIVGGLRTDKLLVYHPAWGHFCLDFGLHQIAIENEGKAPGAGSMVDLFASLEKGNINFIISSPGADRRLAAMVAKQFSLNLVMINPMDTDWMRMMLVMKQALEKNEK